MSRNLQASYALISSHRAARSFVALILFAAFAMLDSFGGTVTGAIHTSTGGAVANGTLTFALTQSAVQSGTATIVTSPVSCYTDASGNVRGLPTPAASVLSTNTASGTLPGASYYVRSTWSNASGESDASAEQTVVLSAQGKVIVTPPASVPASATTFNVYMSSTSGAETKQGTVAGSGTFAAYTQSVALISGAALPSSNTSVCSPLFNDQLQPSYTGYNVSLTNSSGASIPGFPQKWYLSGGASGTINLSSGTPLYSGVVVYPQAVVTIPAGGGLQSISGPLSLNGYALTAGSIAGTFAASNGSAVAPSYSFSSNTGSGFYNVSGTLSVAIGGLLKHFFNTNLNIATDAGCLTFGNSIDSSICRPSAKTFQFGLNDATGTIQTSQVQVADGSASAASIARSGSLGSGIFFSAGGQMEVSTLGVAHAIFSTLGPVIGSNAIYGITSTTDPNNTSDVGLSRCSAGVACIGNGSTGDFSGTIKAAQLQSTVATGTAPFAVQSTTPVTNLTAAPLLYNASGTQQVNPHGVKTDVTLDGGGNGTLTLTGASVFTSSSTWRCSYSDQSGANPVQITYSSGTAASLLGTAAHAISLLCWGT